MDNSTASPLAFVPLELSHLNEFSSIFQDEGSKKSENPKRQIPYDK